MRSVETALIHEQWDTLARIAASLRDRSSPAHVVLDRLVANASDRPAKALTMLGRVVKTIHILQYLHDPQRRTAFSSSSIAARRATPSPRRSASSTTASSGPATSTRS